MMQYTVVVNLLVLLTSCRNVELTCESTRDKTLPRPLFGHQMTYFKQINSIYIFGGLTRKYIDTQFGGGYTTGQSDAIYKCNLSDPSSWFEKINTTTPSEHFYSFSNNVVNIDDKAYFIGVIDNSSFVEGKDGMYLAGHPDPKSDDIYIFDPSTDSFLNTENLTRPEFYGDWSYNCLVSNETHIFFMGPPGYVQMYDVADNVWYSTNQSEVTHGTSCVMIETDIFVFGGGSNRYYKYQWPDKWIQMGNKSVATRRSAVTYSNDSIFIVGGYINYFASEKRSGFDIALADIDIFDIDTESITSTYYMKDWYVGRHEVYASTSIVIGKQLYVFGGCASDIGGCWPSSVVQICDISDPDDRVTDQPEETRQTSDQPEETRQTAENTSNPMTTHAESQKIDEKIDRWVIIVIILVILLVLLMIGVLMLWIFINKKRKKVGYTKTNATDGDIVS